MKALITGASSGIGREIAICLSNMGIETVLVARREDRLRELELISVNITALHTLTKLYLTEFKKKNSGYILNVSSLASFFPGPIFASYYASKAYVMRLSGAIYQELKKAKSDVKISCLCPGPVSTEFGSVAGVKFLGIGMNAAKVAKIAVKGMFKGKRVIVPGFLMKVCRFLSKLLPERLTAKVVMLIQSAKVIR